MCRRTLLSLSLPLPLRYSSSFSSCVLKFDSLSLVVGRLIFVAIVNIWTIVDVDAELSNCSAPPYLITRLARLTIWLLSFLSLPFVRCSICSTNFSKRIFRNMGENLKRHRPRFINRLECGWAINVWSICRDPNSRVWLTVHDHDRLHWLICQ